MNRITARAVIGIRDGPVDFMGEMTKLIQSKRGQLIDVDQTSSMVNIKAKLPVAEMLGWSNDLRSTTEGRGSSSLLEQEFDKVPAGMQQDVIRKIRKRKGLSENQ